jgi:hypothetical protein
MTMYFIYKMTKAGTGKPKVMTSVGRFTASSRKSAVKLALKSRKISARDALMVFTRKELVRANTDV